MKSPLTPRFADPDQALECLAQQLTPVDVEPNQIPAVGRVLGAPVFADRDSPAADVSAMDGYAIRMTDLSRDDSIPIHGESAPGAPPPDLPEGAVVRIFTGALVPSQCDAIVKREDTEETADSIRLLEPARQTVAGMHIRRAGENARSGSRVLDPGVPVTAAVRATMANFGCRSIGIYRRVRVSVITTGDEVGTFLDEAPKPWQLRNSNRESLQTLLTSIPWIEVAHLDHCKDDRQSMFDLISARLGQSDAILLTGGVSMGDYDHVPDVIRDVGGEIVFHGLPIRPGKPILGAATPAGKLIVGLPGNPVSATVGCRRMAVPLLGRLAGLAPWKPLRTTVRVRNPDSKRIPLHWMRLVRLVDHGEVELVESLGSGDLVSLGKSSGFVELPPEASGEGPWPYVAWA